MTSGGDGQVVHLDVGVDPALEVAVAREHRDDGEVGLVDRLADRLGQRAGVADAGRAAVADQVEAELLQVRGELGLLVVVHDDLGPGGQRRLHPRLGRQAALDGVLRQQRGADHDLRVRGVGAGGDRGDDHVAVVDLGLGAVLHDHPGRLGRTAAAGAVDRGVRLAGLAVAVRGRAAGSEAGKDSADRLVDRDWTPSASPAPGRRACGPHRRSRRPARSRPAPRGTPPWPR